MRDAQGQNSINEQMLDALLSAHDGDVALLYLYRLREPEADAEQAARALCMTLAQVSAAQEKLTRMTQPSAAPARPPLSAPAEDELPQCSSADVVRLKLEDEGFAAVLDEAVKVMGRALSSNDMRILFGIYNHLGLPAEIILMLLNFIRECREEMNDKRQLTARAIEKEAYAWANREILTMEQAEEYIRTQKQRMSDIGGVQKALGLGDRPLSPTERRYLSSWLELGFEEEAILIAYDRTVTNTGALKWKYMNSILLSWHTQGLHTPEEIEKKDGAARTRRPSARQRPDRPMTVDELQAIYEKI